MSCKSVTGSVNNGTCFQLFSLRCLVRNLIYFLFFSFHYLFFSFLFPTLFEGDITYWSSVYKSSEDENELRGDTDNRPDDVDNKEGSRNGFGVWKSARVV